MVDRIDAYKAITEARAKIDAAETENRSLSVEEQAFVDRALTDASDIQVKAQRDESKTRLEDAAQTLGDAVNRPIVNGGDGPSANAFDTKEYNDDFLHYVKTGRKSDLLEKAATWSEGTDAAGGAMVPKDFVKEIFAVLFDFAPVLAQARVVDVNTNSVDVPQITVHGASISIPGEAVAVPDSNPTSARKTVTVYKVGGSMKATQELVDDAPFLMDQFIAGELGGQVGAKLNTYLTIGTATGEPGGFLVRATKLFTVSATNTFTADELYSVRNAIIAPYWNRPGSHWQMNQATYNFISTLKDSQSRYLLGDLATGGGFQLLGAPVKLNPDVQVYTTTAKKFISFGDLTKGYLVLRRPTVSLKRSDDRYFDTDEIGFKLTVRYGADVIDPGAIAVGKTA